MADLPPISESSPLLSDEDVKRYSEDTAATLTLDDTLSIIGIGKFHWKLLLVCAAGWMVDGMSLTVVSNSMSRIQTEWQISTDYIGLMSSLLASGACAGALLWGRMADKLGRRAVFVYTCMISGIAIFAAAFSPNYYVLLALLFLCGTGIGGNVPVDGAMFSEFLPKEVRGRMMMLMAVAWGLGPLIINLLSLVIIPRFSCPLTARECIWTENLGWRYLLGIFGIINLITCSMRWFLPESPTYLYKRGFKSQAKAILDGVAAENGVTLPPCVLHIEDIEEQARTIPTLKALSLLFADQLCLVTPLIWVFWLCLNFGYAGFSTFLPKLYEEKGIQNLSSVYMYTLVPAVASAIGPFLGAGLVETPLGRRYTMALGTAICGLSMLLFALPFPTWTLQFFASAMLAFDNAVFAALLIYATEVYPTLLRGTANGIAHAIGRVASIVSPFVTGFLIHISLKVDLYTGFAVISVGAITIALLPLETRGRALQ